MRLPIPLAVGSTILRELLRAALTPLRIALFLPRRRRYLQAAREALGDAPAGTDADLPLLLAERARAAGPGDRPHVLISCGEASGEIHAVRLLQTVDAACADDEALRSPRYSAFGGERLRDAGAELLYPLSEHAIFGLLGVFLSIGFITRAHARFLRLLRDDPPDLIVLIDYPGLHLVFAEAARRHGVPVLHYVAPQYWAWGPWRLQRYRRAVDATLTILPFEPTFFGRVGLPSAYVGHPLLDGLADAAAHPVELRDDQELLVLMPGSRRKEIHLHLPAMLEIAARLKAEWPQLRVVIPHREQPRIDLIHSLLAEQPAAHTAGVEVQHGDPGPWLRAARAALVKSGTGSLEACLHGAPTVVVYVIQGALARWVLRNLLTVPYFAGANLCMGRDIVPEIPVESADDWRRAGAALQSLLNDGETRSRCLADLAALQARLGRPGATARVAHQVLPFCAARNPTAATPPAATPSSDATP